jgi:hypothetical protein
MATVTSMTQKGSKAKDVSLWSARSRDKSKYADLHCALSVGLLGTFSKKDAEAQDMWNAESHTYSQDSNRVWVQK